MARVPEVLVVDQDPRARFELKGLLKKAQLKVVGEAAFGTEAVSLASETTPDVVMCGISRPPDRSLQTIQAILDMLPETPVIAYGQTDDVEVVRQAVLVGARDFLIMPAEAERLVESVRSVLESEERKRLRLSGQSKAFGPRGLIIAVFAAKGGVGKSTIATNLAVALVAELHQSVAIIDGDSTFGDVADLLDLKPERSIVELVRNIDSVDRDSVTDHLIEHSSGLWVLPAPRETLAWRSVPPDRFRKVLSILTRRFDIVLVDMAAMLAELSLATLEEANMVLWITSSDFSSVNHAMQGLETLRQLSYPESRIRLVLNDVSSENGVRPSKIETALGRQFFWHVPYDRELRVGSQVGRPAALTSPTCRGAQSIIEMAQTIVGVGPKPVPRSSPLRRLFARRGGDATATPPAEGR